MNIDILLAGLAGILATAAPILFATIGETFTERAGVINLSVNGPFAFGNERLCCNCETNSLALGFLTGILVGRWWR